MYECMNGAPYYHTIIAQGNFISIDSYKNQLLCNQYDEGKIQPLFISHRNKVMK